MGNDTPSSSSPLLRYQDDDANDALAGSDADTDSDDSTINMRTDDDGTNEYSPQDRDQEMGNITRVFSSHDSSKPFQSHSEVRDADAAMMHATDYKVYKRRFFGLTQLVLLNIVVSWDVCED